MHRVLVPIAALLCFGPLAREAQACRIREAGRRGAAADWPGSLVDSAAVIVRATAVGDTLGGVTAAVREWVRGRPSSGAPPGRAGRADTLWIGGHFVDRDDYNRSPVPYLFVRPAGGRGSCYAREYRRGAEYLFLLRPDTSAGRLTPYWSPLAPVNEQVRGADDPWVAWVRARAARAAPGPGGA